MPRKGKSATAKFATALNKTGGFLVGYTIGYPLGPITASARLLAELNWLRQLIQLHHDDPEARKEIAKRAAFISLMLAGAPLYFATSPSWGSARGAEVGLHVGFIHSFIDVPYEAMKITPRLDKIEGRYYTKVPISHFYKDRKKAREAKKAVQEEAKQADNYFDLDDPEKKQARKRHGLFPGLREKALHRTYEEIENEPLVGMRSSY